MGLTRVQTWRRDWRLGPCIEAVSFVLERPDRRALCLVRPPGHHARPAEGMGFCIYANVAVAAAEALARISTSTGS